MQQPTERNEIINEINGNLTNPPTQAMDYDQSYKQVNDGAIPPMQRKGIKIAHLNCRGLLGKIDDLKQLLSFVPFNVMCFTETFLDDSVSDGEVYIPGYRLYRNDRNRNGGGVAIFIDENLSPKLIPITNCNVEALSIEILPPKQKPFKICVIYRPPNADVQSFYEIEEYISKLCNGISDVIVLGDFNCNMDPSVDCYKAKKLNDIAVLYQLDQLINGYTRIAENSKSIIDLILTNNKEYHSESGIYATTISDHFLIYTIYGRCNVKNKEQIVSMRKFKNFHPEIFVDDLRARFIEDDVNEVNGVDLSVDSLNKAIIDVLNCHAPIHNKRVRNKTCEWITPVIVSLMHDRDYYGRKARLSNDPLLWDMYKKLRNQVTNEIKKSKSNYVCTSIMENKSNIWVTLNKVLPRKNKSLPSSFIIDDSLVEDDLIIANEFNKYFTSIASSIMPPGDIELGQSNECHTNRPMFSLPFVTVQFVLDTIDKMSVNVATGLDGVSCKIVKLSKLVIAPTIAGIINKSFTLGTVPETWKEARVTPIHKAGDMTCVGNYRPISVLPILSKIMERVVHEHLYLFLLNNNVLCQNQSGFRPKHSCATALLNIVDKWLRNMDEGRVNGVLLVDLSKAFDTVNHEILLHKLHEIGCNDLAVKWFRSYLCNRTQKVSYKCHLSESMGINVGVPQGSILGPLLFSIFINDLPSEIANAQVEMYADDTTIHTAATDIDVITSRLTEAAHQLTTWLKRNRLVLNVKKTKLLLIGSSRKLNELKESPRVTVYDQEIECVDSAKILGVVIDSNLNFHKHVDSIFKTASSKLYVIRRLKPFVPLSELSILFNALVMPHLLYCSSVWCHRNKANVDKLFKVQKRAARLITNSAWDTDSSHLLNYLKWTPLPQRYVMNDLIMLFKCKHNLVPEYLCNGINVFQSNNGYSTRQSENGTMILPVCKTEMYRKSFFFMAPKLWNNLDNEIKKLTSLRSFKRNLMKSDLSSLL